MPVHDIRSLAVRVEISGWTPAAVRVRDHHLAETSPPVSAMPVGGRLNLVLVCVAIALVLWVMWEPDDDATGAVPRLAAIEPGAVTRIQIQPVGQESVALAKHNGRWHLTRPMEIPADHSLADAITAVLRTQSHTQLAVGPERLQDFGLAPPRVRLRIDNLELAFGDTEPLHGRRYVLSEGTVHLVADQFLHYLTQPAEHFVHPAPLGPQAEPVALALPSLNLELVDNQWRVQSAGPMPPAHTVTALVDAWRQARAVAVQKKDPTVTALERVRVRVRGMPAPLDFEVARRGGEFLLIRPDLEIQYVLSAQSAERLINAKADREAGAE